MPVGAGACHRKVAGASCVGMNADEHISTCLYGLVAFFQEGHVHITLPDLQHLGAQGVAKLSEPE